MAQWKSVLPYGLSDEMGFDRGTRCLGPSPRPGSIWQGECGGRSAFDSAIRGLEAEIANAGAHLVIDGEARSTYAKLVRGMADDLAGQVKAGRLTWAQAAEQANESRNAIMDVIRSRSTPVGRAMAEQMKAQGLTLNALIARKTTQLFGKEASFPQLSAAQQNTVFAEIVNSAGKSNPRVTANLAKLNRFGRGLLVVSIGISVYTVATSDDKLAAAGREAAVTGGGIAGGIAGGALAGLACGPGAPACVTVGAFVGGALAAFGIDWLW